MMRDVRLWIPHSWSRNFSAGSNGALPADAGAVSRFFTADQPFSNCSRVTPQRFFGEPALPSLARRKERPNLGVRSGWSK
jgi:hypothetical protein